MAGEMDDACCLRSSGGAERIADVHVRRRTGFVRASGADTVEDGEECGTLRAGGHWSSGENLQQHAVGNFNDRRIGDDESG